MAADLLELINTNAVKQPSKVPRHTNCNTGVYSKPVEHLRMSRRTYRSGVQPSHRSRQTQTRWSVTPLEGAESASPACRAARTSTRADKDKDKGKGSSSPLSVELLAPSLQQVATRCHTARANQNLPRDANGCRSAFCLRPASASQARIRY
jgi:hypothetical protein